MNRKTIIFAMVISFSLTGDLWAQHPTGTRITGPSKITKQTIVWLTGQNEINRILDLLQAGEKQRAVELASAYVRELDALEGGEAQTRRYFALSALCSALTTTGMYAEAISYCSDAVNIFPSRWQALNNRGVAYYVTGQIDKARQDYQEALSHAMDSEPGTDLIKHNINLAESKK